MRLSLLRAVVLAALVGVVVCLFLNALFVGLILATVALALFAIALT